MSRAFDDGASEYLLASDSSVSAAPMTLSAWFWTDDLVTQNQTALCVYSNSSNHWTLAVDNDPSTEVRVYAQSAAAEGIALSTTFALVRTWHHICGVYEASNSRAAYLDGGGKGINSVDVTPATPDKMTIGSMWTTWWYMSGQLAEPAIWDVALTDREVLSLARGMPPWMISRDRLVGFWLPFADRTDRDFSGRGHHMVPFNAPTWGPEPPKVVSRYRINRYHHADESGRVWWMPWAKPPAAIAGQPMNLRATAIPGMRQWHPRGVG